MTTSSEVVLRRIKRKLQRERAFYRRGYEDEVRHNRNSPYRERTWYEMTTMDVAIGIVNKELRALDVRTGKARK